MKIHVYVQKGNNKNEKKETWYFLHLQLVIPIEFVARAPIVKFYIDVSTNHDRLAFIGLL